MSMSGSGQENASTARGTYMRMYPRIQIYLSLKCHHNQAIPIIPTPEHPNAAAKLSSDVILRQHSGGRSCTERTHRGVGCTVCGTCGSVASEGLCCWLY